MSTASTIAFLCSFVMKSMVLSSDSFTSGILLPRLEVGTPSNCIIGLEYLPVGEAQGEEAQDAEG